MAAISGHTQTVGLVGLPTHHSSSPAMHNYSFDKLNIDAVYVCHDVDEENVEAAIRGMQALGYAGANVTMPYKTKVLGFMDEITPTAQLMGAINTIQFKDGKMIGHNTDGLGLLEVIESTGVNLPEIHMVVLGAGGAGSAVFVAAAIKGVKNLKVFNANDEFFEPTRQRLAHISEVTGANLELVDLGDKDALKAAVAEADVVVDATRVGMGDLADQANLEQSWIREGQIIVDTTYEPVVTELLRRAQAAGAHAISGLTMLVAQGALGEKIWFDADMPIEDVKKNVFQQEV